MTAASMLAPATVSARPPDLSDPGRSTALRPHQQAAVEDVRATFAAGATRAVLVLPCGTGKTFVGAALAADAGNRVVVFLPSLALVEQTLREWSRLPDLDVDPVIVCSDPSTAAGAAERGAGDPFTRPVPWHERAVPVTTDPDRLARLLSRGPRHGRQVVFCTYHSAPVLAAAARYAAVPVQFDLLVADEAHRLAGRPSEAFRLVLDDDAVPAAHRLFMTATPVVAEADDADDSTSPRVSMDDQRLFGPVAHRMTFAEAIDAGLLVDYQVLVVADRLATSVDGNRLAAAELAALAALRTAAETYGLQRVLTFHGRVAAAERFAGLLAQSGPLPDGRATWSRVVAADMSARQRRDVLDGLIAAGTDRLAVVSNARVLGEGVDLPSVDGIVFAHPKQSVVDIVQSVGRVLRRADGKTVGTVIVPVSLPDDGGDDDSALLTSRFGHVWTVLRALRAHDERLAFQLDRITRSDSRRGSHDGSRHVDRISWLLPPDLVPAATLRCVREVGSSWERFFGLLERYVDTVGDARVPRGYVTDGLTRAALGEWVQRQRTAYRRRLLPPARVARLAALPGWVWDLGEAAWLDGYAEIRTVAQRWHDRGEPFDWAALSQRPVGAPGRRAGRRGRHRTLGLVAAAARVAYRAGELDPVRVEQLEAVPGWTWHPLPAADEAMVDRLAEFVLWERTANVPAGHVESGAALGDWLVGVRARKFTGSLPAALLDELLVVTPPPGPGALRWDHLDTQWQVSFAALTQFASREGHVRVPLPHREALADLGGHEVHLGRWVVVQRHARRHNRMRPDRAVLLEQLPGWRWEVEPAARVRVVVGEADHGTRTGYVKGCRCRPCTDANTAANQAREQRRAAGLGTTDLVDAARARGHVRILKGRGATLVGMARAAEVNPKTIVELADGTLRRVHPETERRVLALTLDAVRDAAVPGTRVPAGPTWELLDDLLRRRWPKAWIARELGLEVPSLQISRVSVLAGTAQKVAALHARVGDRVPPPHRRRSKLPTLDELEVQAAPQGVDAA